MSKKASTITRLDYWRRLKGLTTEALGEQLGVKQPTASRYCRGRQHPQNADVRKAIFDLTDGYCHAGNFDELVDAETGAPAALSPVHRASGDQSQVTS